MKPLSSVAIRIGFADLLDPSQRRVHAMLQHRFGRTPDCPARRAVQVLCNRDRLSFRAPLRRPSGSWERPDSSFADMFE
jgi:hypothetical protein